MFGLSINFLSSSVRLLLSESFFPFPVMVGRKPSSGDCMSRMGSEAMSMLPCDHPCECFFAVGHFVIGFYRVGPSVPDVVIVVIGDVAPEVCVNLAACLIVLSG